MNSTGCWILLCLWVLPLVGCEPSPRANRSAYPVDGQLLVKEMPAVGAKMTFRRIDIDDPIDFTATVKSDGHFVPVQQDGAIGLPEGTYALTVVWEIDGADRFEGRHSDANSPLATITVRNEVNLLEPIRLP